MNLFRSLFLPACSPALVLALFVTGCGGPAQNDQNAEGANLPKIDPPELVLRNFYVALDDNAPEVANALISKRSRPVDPKAGGLVSNTSSLIQNNGGIAKFKVLKIGEETLENEQRADGGTEELRTVTVEFEITFNNGTTRSSESRLIYEPIEKPEEADAEPEAGNASPASHTPPAPAGFGWRVEAVKYAWQE